MPFLFRYVKCYELSWRVPLGVGSTLPTPSTLTLTTQRLGDGKFGVANYLGRCQHQRLEYLPAVDKHGNTKPDLLGHSYMLWQCSPDPA